MINANQQDHELIGRKVTGFYKQIEEGDAQLIYMEERAEKAVYLV
jgi:mRNA-degrading endonuclease YafQ of YafQ-DinJ toxin-antitoxin module